MSKTINQVELDKFRQDGWSYPIHITEKCVRELISNEEHVTEERIKALISDALAALTNAEEVSY